MLQIFRDLHVMKNKNKSLTNMHCSAKGTYKPCNNLKITYPDWIVHP